MAKEKPKGAVQKKGASYLKGQIINSEKFAERRDLLSAILADDREYSIEDVEREIKAFYERKVD